MSNPQNLSSSFQQEGDAKRPSDRLDKDQPGTERGQSADFNRSSGEVSGSGAGAGGGNFAEDYDSDPKGGGGAEPMGGPRTHEDAEHGPRDKHEGYNH